MKIYNWQKKILEELNNGVKFILESINRIQENIFNKIIEALKAPFQAYRDNDED